MVRLSECVNSDSRHSCQRRACGKQHATQLIVVLIGNNDLSFLRHTISPTTSTAMNLDQLRAFVTVVQNRSFTKAAARLDTEKGHLSRLVSQLEKKLDAKLLERTTRAINLTEIGREVYERAVGILAAVEDTERAAQQLQGEPRGVLRVTCGVEFGMLAVSGWIDEYLVKYPGVNADVDFTSRMVDLVHEGFDVAIRLGSLEDSRLAARRLGELEYGLFACPRYLTRAGTPATIEELKSHALLIFSAGSHRSGWRLRNIETEGERDVRIEGPARLKLNNSFAIRDAALRSLGVAQLPLLVAGEWIRKKRLVPVLPEWRPGPVPVHAVFPSSRYLTPKVRTFVDLAVERFPQGAV
jgi:LysR family transcriptional regulator, regulator for bpeEF and oprC